MSAGAEAVGTTFSDAEEFDYRPMSPWGPVALVLGICSLSGFLGLFGLGIAAFGVLTGLIAVFRIRSEGTTVQGRGLAWTGFLLASSSLVLGSAKMGYAYSTECPEGYARVNFPSDISDKQFLYFQGARQLHPDVAPLKDQKIFIKGFMWETQKPDGLDGFVFLKDNGECCFGGSPQPYDMMYVRMQNGDTTKAYTGLVSVGGTLTVNLEAEDKQPVYILKADFVEEAQTAF